MRRAALATLFCAAVACGGDPSAPAVITALPRELSAAEQEAISAGNRFTFDLLRELDRTHEGENLFVSPLSASMALGMTLNGARTTTFDGMRTPLAALGMAEAFDGSRADFSGVSQAVYNAGERLFLTRVLQKTFVAVDEAGTEAAAATVVGAAPASVPPTVTFDRPFVFAIRERFSGTILFIGEVADPSRTS